MIKRYKFSDFFFKFGLLCNLLKVLGNQKQCEEEKSEINDSFQSQSIKDDKYVFVYRFGENPLQTHQVLHFTCVLLV